MINIIIRTVKRIIYIDRNGSTDLHLKQVKMVMRDLFLIEKYWAKTNEKLPSFHFCKAISFLPNISHCYSYILSLMQLSR